jgi:trimethylamine:corrinoid methyltransferase-like protein
VIDRANRSRWQEEGSLTLGERARREVEKHLAAYELVKLSDEIKHELTGLMRTEARRYGMDQLPQAE